MNRLLLQVVIALCMASVVAKGASSTANDYELLHAAYRVNPADASQLVPTDVVALNRRFNGATFVGMVGSGVVMHPIHSVSNPCTDPCTAGFEHLFVRLVRLKGRFFNTSQELRLMVMDGTKPPAAGNVLNDWQDNTLQNHPTNITIGLPIAAVIIAVAYRYSDTIKRVARNVWKNLVHPSDVVVSQNG